MSYNVNGCSTNLETGNGILVNSRQLHHGYSTDHTECEFICILLHPLLLCASEYYGKQYVELLISSAALYSAVWKYCLAKRDTSDSETYLRLPGA